MDLIEAGQVESLTRSGCLCVTDWRVGGVGGWGPRGVLFALKPTCARRFVLRQQREWVFISRAKQPSASLASCPQMPIPAGWDYWWHVPAWNNTEAAVSGYEGRKEPHLEIWQGRSGGEQT